MIEYIGCFKELEKLKESNTDFDLVDQYKLNSHIFKQNIVLLINLIIDDVWA